MFAAALLWVLLSWQLCQSTLLVNLTLAKSKADKTQIYSMVVHPFNSGEALITQSNHYIASLDLTTLSITQLSDGEGNKNAVLVESKFRRPRDVVKIGENTFAIADQGNNCIRKLWYIKGQSKVTNLSGNESSCAFQGHLEMFKSPLALAVDRHGVNLYILYDSLCIVKLNIDASSAENIEQLSAMSSKFNGLTTSSFFNRLYIILTDNVKTKVVTMDTDTGIISEMASIPKSKRVAEQVDGLLTGGHSSFYRNCTGLTRRRNERLTLVGSHLVLSVCNAVYDLDFEADRLTYISKLSASSGVGSLAYFDDPVTPDHLYVWQNNMIYKYSVDACKTRRRERLPVYSYSWLRTGGYGCKNIDQHKIETLSYVIGQAVADAQASTCVAPQSCFSLCKKKCEEMDSCVAFQCDSRDELCTLSKCALISDLPATYLSCYRLADVVYAQPSL